MADITYIYTSNAPEPIGPYSQAAMVNGFLFVSGQIPIDPQTGELIIGTIESETKQVFSNLRGILNEAKMDFSHVLRASVYLTDIRNFQAMNQVYQEFFSSNFPAREIVESSHLPKGANIEISIIAFRNP
jgi:2-iminobutanoate/2-iminopropanoate deaminase